MKLNKSESSILDAINAVGYVYVSYGERRNGWRSYPFGLRKKNAMKSLIAKGLVVSVSRSGGSSNGYSYSSERLEAA